VLDTRQAPGTKHREPVLRRRTRGILEHPPRSLASRDHKCASTACHASRAVDQQAPFSEAELDIEPAQEAETDQVVNAEAVGEIAA
jgi:hypothetical protein